MSLTPIVIEDGEIRIEQDEVGASSWTPYIKSQVVHKDGTISSTWKHIDLGENLITIVRKVIKIRQNARNNASNQDYVQSIKFTLPESFDLGVSNYFKLLCDFNLKTVDLTKDLIRLQRENTQTN